MATLYDLAQAYLNRGLPDISGIFGDNTNNTLSPIDFGGEEPVSPQGLTPEQLALLYSQNNNVNKGGGDSSNFIGTIPENYYTPQGAGTIANNNILDGSITSDLVDEFAPNRFDVPGGIASFGLANNPDEEEEDYVEQSKLGKFGNAFQTLRESPFSTIAAISRGLPGIITSLALGARRGGTNYQQFTPGMTYNQDASMINDAYDPATGTNRFDRAKPGTFGSFRTLADYFGRDKNDGPGSTTGNTTEATQDNQDGFGGSCFIAGTKVTMADGTFKNIEDIKVGDKVKGHKEDNEVIKLDPTLLANRKLYSFNNNEHYFFTSEHPFMTEEGWKSVKPEKTKERDGIELYNQLEGELKIGDKLVTDKGLIEITDIKSKEINKPKMPLYNFNVSNDNSYIADNYIVHNKGGGGGGDTYVCTASYANNLITPLDFKALKKYGIKLRRNDKYLMKAYDWFGPKLAAMVKKGKLVNFAKHSTSMWKYEQTKQDVSFKMKFMIRFNKIITRPIIRTVGVFLTIKEKLTK